MGDVVGSLVGDVVVIFLHLSRATRQSHTDLSRGWQASVHTKEVAPKSSYANRLIVSERSPHAPHTISTLSIRTPACCLLFLHLLTLFILVYTPKSQKNNMI